MNAALPIAATDVLAELPCSVIIFDAAHRVVYANRRVVERLAANPDTLAPGTPLEAVVRLLAYRGTYGAGDPETLVQRQLRQDRSKPSRRVMRQADGSVLEVASVPLPDGGFVSYAFEVTHLVAPGLEAEAQARRLETVLNRLHGGVSLWDAQGRVVLSNRAYEELIGLRGLVREGMSYEELLRELIRRGEFINADQDELVEQRLSIDRSRPHVHQRERPNGDVVRFESQPVAEGGYLIEVTDVTAMKRAEDEAKRRAALIDGVLNALPHGVAVFGPDQRLSMVNGAYDRIMAGAPAAIGEHRDDIARRRALAGEYGEGDPEELVRANVVPLFGREQAARQRVRPNGTVIEVRAAPLPDGGYVQVTTDITALQQAQAEATQRAAQLQAMLNHMRHGIVLFDRDHRLVLLNPLAVQLFGADPQVNYIGMTLRDVMHRLAADGRMGEGAAMQEAVETSLAIDRSKPHRYLRQRDGLVVEVVSDPIPDGGFVITYSDITARMAAEEAARERAATLQALIDNMRQGVTLWGADRRLRAWNSLATDLSGNSPGILRPALPLEEAIVDICRQDVRNDPAEYEKLAASAIQLDRSKPQRHIRTKRDGRVIEVTSDPMPDGGFIVSHTDITPLARAEEEARQRAATLQVMLDSMRHGIALFDRDRRLVAANALAGTIGGTPDIESRIGETLDELVELQRQLGLFGEGEEGHARVARLVALDRGKSHSYQRLRPDGRITEIVSDPTPDGGFVITWSDVTALVRAEEQARQRAEHLQAMLDNLRHGIVLYGPDRRIIAANRLSERLGGHAPGTVSPGRSIDQLIEEQLAAGAFGQGAVARQVASMAQQLDRSRPARYMRNSGDGKVLEVTSDPTPQGGFVVTMADITPLARAEAESKRRADILQVMLDNIRHGICLFDVQRRIVAVNPIVAQMLELPPALLAPGTTMEEFVGAMQRQGEFGEGAAAQAMAHAIINRDRSFSNRTVRTRPNGHVIEVVSDPTPDGGWVMTYTDVSEDRRIRDELERAKNAAETANRAKSRFLATMTHELRTPLNAVIGFSEAMRGGADPSRNEEFIGAIHEAGKLLLSLIDDILDVARAETAGFQVHEGEVALPGLIEGVVRVMQAAAASARVTVQAQLPPVLPRLRADDKRLRQVLLNLVSNAVKFTPAGGAITLRALHDWDGALLLEVVDTGIGIPAEDLARVFEPFTQLDSSLARRFGGSGLGLYLSRALAEAQGATLTLESGNGAGTTARLRFPAERVIASV